VPFFKGDIMKNTIEYIKELENKIKHLEDLDRKNMLSIIKLQNKITDYETNFIEYYKYHELQDDYWQLQNCYNYEKNKNKGVK
jgi:hypothetical protein